MEYIKKTNLRFYACVDDDVNFDNKKYFDSRRNYQGLNGNQISIKVGDFDIEWKSNFGYGSWSFGIAFVNFKKIFIMNYNNINTTKDFVKILNKYLNITEYDKDEIIVDLANRLAHFREISKENMASSINHEPSSSNPKYLRPIIKIDKITSGIDTLIIDKLRSKLEDNK